MLQPTPLPSPEPERNLLFGALALQADLLDEAQFAEACSAWAATKSVSLPDLLMERGWLTPDERAELERLLERKVKKHGGDLRTTLAALTTDELRRSLSSVPDAGAHGSSPVADRGAEGHERYTLQSLHATGGIGRVWLARDPNMGREVALKDLRPEGADNPAIRGRFLQEARITGQLEHPGVVPVYEVGHRPGDRRPFYTMRFVRGRTLSAALQAYHRKRTEGGAGALDLHSLLNAFVGVCNTIAYAHARGVIHRDLKPQNVVLGDFGEVIVLDWGLAKVLDGAGGEGDAEPLPAAPDAPGGGTMQGQVLGTPAYMAPEQAAGRLDLVDRRTDVYGLGAILYEILTGRLPFSGGGTHEVLRRVQESAPPRPRQVSAAVPPALEAVCLRAMAKRAEDRYPSAADLADEVRHWLADEPVRAYPEPLTRRAARWARRHKALVGGAAAVLLTVCAALAAGVVLIGQEQARTEHERNVAVAARKQADANAAAEEVARRRADANAELAGAQRQLALETLQILVTDVQEQLEDTPGNHRLKQGLLTAALAGLERLAGSAEKSRDAGLPMIDAHQRMGDVFLVLGRHDQARRQFERARGLAESLVKAAPDNRDARRELARAYRGLGKVGHDSGRAGEARVYCEKSLALLRPLLAADARDARVRRELTLTRWQLGEVCQDVGAHAAARDHYRESLTLAGQALAARADDVQARVDAALAQAGLAQTTLHLGDVAAAQDWARKGRDVLEPLLRGDKHKNQASYGLGVCLQVLADTTWKRGNASAAREDFARSLKLIAALAAADPKSAFMQRELSVSYNRLGDVCLDLGAMDEALTHYRAAAGIMEKLIPVVERRARAQEDLALAYQRLGRASAQAGKVAEAWDYLQKCPPLMKPVLDEDPKNAEARRNLCIVYELQGMLSVRKGDPSGARDYFGKSIALAKERLAGDPKAVRWRRDLAIAYQKAADAELQLGDTARAREQYGKALGHLEAVATADPRSAEAKQDLALAHRWVAESDRRLGDAKGALGHARKCQELLEGILGEDAKRTGVKRDLGIIWVVLGELHQDRGKPDTARDFFARAIRLSEELLEADPKDARFRRDVLVAHNRMGDLLLGTGQAATALEHYLKSFAKAEAVAKLDAASAEARFDLAWGHMRLCDARLGLNRVREGRADADKAVALLRPLAAADPKNTDFGTALGSGALRVGRAALALHDLPAARAAFAEAARAFGGLVKAHPTEARFQRDLLIAYNRQGDVCVENLNDLTAGGEFYRKSFALAEALAWRHPDNMDDQTNVVLGLQRLGQHALQAAEHAKAVQHYQQAIAVVRRLDEQGKLDTAPVYMPRLPELQRMIAICRVAQRGANDPDFAMAQAAPAAKAMLLQRVQILARTGKHAEAAEAAEKLRELGPEKNVAALFDVARCYALCAAGVAPGKETDKLTKEEQAGRAKYAARALEVLNQAVECGFRHVLRLEADSDLAAIRSEVGFRKLLERLKGAP